MQIIEQTCYHDTRLIISFHPKYPDNQGREEHNTDGLLSSRPTGAEANLLICGPWLTQLHVCDNGGNKYEQCINTCRISIQTLLSTMPSAINHGTAE